MATLLPKRPRVADCAEVAGLKLFEKCSGAPRKTGGTLKVGKIQTVLLGSNDPAMSIVRTVGGLQLMDRPVDLQPEVRGPHAHIGLGNSGGDDFTRSAQRQPAHF